MDPSAGELFPKVKSIWVVLNHSNLHRKKCAPSSVTLLNVKDYVTLGESLTWYFTSTLSRDDGEQQFTKRIDKLQTFEDNIEIINSKLRNFFGPQVLHDEVYDVVVKPMQSKTNFRSYYSPPSLDGERTGIGIGRYYQCVISFSSYLLFNNED